MANLATSIELVPLDQIKPYPDNAKIHSPDQVSKIVAQIQAHGWDVPIVLEPNGTIIKGHGRYLAAKELGLVKVPCIRTKMTEAQAKAARIADNKVSEAPWDEKLLKIDFESLKSIDFDLSLTGFDILELDFYLGVDEGDIRNASALKSSEEIEDFSDAAHVRMLQLFLNDSSHPEMMKMLTELQHHYDLSNITDTCVEAIREVYKAKFPN